MKIELTPITAQEAREIAAWSYPPPYDYYNIPSEHRDGALIDFLAPGNRYHAARSERGELTAFFCFGPDARVPGGRYEEPALDVGLGLRPDLIGRGLGGEMLAQALEFAVRAFQPARFRTTIALFNARSRRVFERAGFVEEHVVGDRWVQLSRVAAEPPSSRVEAT